MSSSRNIFQKALISEYGVLGAKRDDETVENFEKRMLKIAFFTAKLMKIDNCPKRVLDYLYIGSIGSAYSLENLKEFSITHIICAAESPQLKFENYFQYLRCNLLDDPVQCDENYLIEHIFPLCNSFISGVLSNEGTLNNANEENLSTAAAPNQNRVLVHCYMGCSRSACICCAYLIYAYKMSVKEALDTVRIERPMAEPNSAFMSALYKYYDQITGDTIAANSPDGS